MIGRTYFADYMDHRVYLIEGVEGWRIQITGPRPVDLEKRLWDLAEATREAHALTHWHLENRNDCFKDDCLDWLEL